MPSPAASMPSLRAYFGHVSPKSTSFFAVAFVRKRRSRPRGHRVRLYQLQGSLGSREDRQSRDDHEDRHLFIFSALALTHLPVSRSPRPSGLYAKRSGRIQGDGPYLHCFQGFEVIAQSGRKYGIRRGTSSRSLPRSLHRGADLTPGHGGPLVGKPLRLG